MICYKSTNITTKKQPNKFFDVIATDTQIKYFVLRTSYFVLFYCAKLYLTCTPKLVFLTGNDPEMAGVLILRSK